MLYRKQFHPDAALKVTEEDAARTRELIREHINDEELEKEFPTYVLDEHFLTKLKDKKPDAKALDIEAMLTAELRIRWIRTRLSSSCPRGCSVSSMREGLGRWPVSP